MTASPAALSSFDVVPGVHVQNRRFTDSAREGTPVEQATALAREFGSVYVVDVDAVRVNRPDVEFLQDLCRARPVWLDTGPRDASDAMDAFIAGAERLTVRWGALRGARNLDELADLAEPETVLVMLEFEDGRFVRSPRERHLDEAAVLKMVRDHGFGAVASAPAFDASIARRVGAEGASWWYGPVRRAEATELRRLGYQGAVVPEPLAREAAEGARDAEVTPE